MGDAGGRHQPIKGSTALLRDGLDHGGPALGGGEVGQHLGVAHVDADDGVTVGLQALPQRAADAAR